MKRMFSHLGKDGKASFFGHFRKHILWSWSEIRRGRLSEKTGHSREVSHRISGEKMTFTGSIVPCGDFVHTEIMCLLSSFVCEKNTPGSEQVILQRVSEQSKEKEMSVIGMERPVPVCFR